VFVLLGGLVSSTESCFRRWIVLTVLAAQTLPLCLVCPMYLCVCWKSYSPAAVTPGEVLPAQWVKNVKASLFDACSAVWVVCLG
jgi:hypothetical protein